MKDVLQGVTVCIANVLYVHNSQHDKFSFFQTHQ